MNQLGSRKDIDVLIVGAGPVGLMTACELVKRGITCRIIDKRKERTRISKAMAVHARTMEIMDLTGMAEPFVQKGYIAPGLSVLQGTQARQEINIDMYRLDTSFPYVLICPQYETEGILEEHLANLGVTVERNVSLNQFEQDDNGVFAQVQEGNGQAYPIRARYIVGCDGSQSTVREQLGIPFNGKKYDVTAFMGDVKIEGDYTKGHLQNIGTSRGFVLLVPFRDDYVRVIAIDHQKQMRTATNELPLEELQDTVDAIHPKKLLLKEPRWLTRFKTAAHKQVTQYSQGRAFLVGDAAHIHAPAGGQGMNTGLQDAFNLAWKLALNIKHQAPEQLLTTYHTERHPIGSSVLRFTDTFFKNFLVKNPIVKTARNFMANTILPTEFVQKKIGERMSGIGLNYRFTEESKQLRNKKLSLHVKQVGDRIPDLELKGEKDFIKLYDLLRKPWFKLFLYISVEEIHRNQLQLQKLLQKITTLSFELIQPYVILNKGVPESVNTEIPRYIDFKREFETKIGTEDQSILLVRPDGYLAFHEQGWDEDRLLSAIGNWVKI